MDISSNSIKDQLYVVNFRNYKKLQKQKERVYMKNKR